MTLLIFIVVFAGLVLVHEFGHYAAARLQKVEVEEFAIGLPPRLWRYWRTKGRMTIDGKTLVIPNNFDLPFDWRTGLDGEVIATADEVKGKLELRTIKLQKPETTTPAAEENVEPQGNPMKFEWNPTESPAPKEVGTKLPPGSITVQGKLTALETGTEFTINWLPLGGFMRPKGEMDPTAPGGLAAASPWTRLWVLLAGPAMNLATAALVFSLIFVQTGVPVADKVILSEVMADSPAALAGLAVGDLIVNANGEDITSVDQFRALIYANLDKPVSVTYERNGEQFTVEVTPSSERTQEEGATGILLGNPVEKAGILPSLWLGLRATGAYIHEMVTLPARLIQGAIPAEQARLVGLKGMYDFMSQAVQSDTQSRQPQAPTTGTATPQATNYTLIMIGMLSVSLGIFNLFPIPALDGGRILFLLPELIFRRRVPANVETAVHMVGFVILMALMLYVNAMDFINPVVTTLP